MSRTLPEILEDVKAQLKVRRGCSIKQLARTFKQNDQSGDGSFDFDEWSMCLQRAGIFLKNHEMSRVFQSFDTDKSGSISYEEFLVGISRGKLSGRRAKICLKAFAKFDKNDIGIVYLNDMKAVYDPTTHPKVLSGELKEEQAYKSFINSFNGTLLQKVKKKPIRVSLEEFMAYMAELSSYIPASDDKFVQMVEKAFKVREVPSAEMKEMDKKKLDSLKDEIREKVRQRTKCSKFENVTLYRACRHFDTDDSGDIDCDEFSHALNTLGIHLPENEKEALFESFRPQNGAISYWDFSKALFRDTEPDLNTSMTKTIGRKEKVPSGPNKILSPIAKKKIPQWAMP
mmetsp:Transcript_22658/g.36410  ORF Transcript_22658/g.36410 Transcript_22658/m.36410 type:complete len:343 (+) Transcript_22658:133-1161(+)